MSWRADRPKPTTAIFLALILTFLMRSPTLAQEVQCPIDLQLTDQVVTETVEEKAKNSIGADMYLVSGEGDVALIAGDFVALGDGFSVESGGEFRAIIDPDVLCEASGGGGGGDGGGGIDPEKNIVAIHNRQSDQYKKDCNECHAEIHSRTSLVSYIPAAHLGMFEWAAGKPGSNKQCMWCHRTVDLVQGVQTKGDSIGNLRRHTDARLCTVCHGPDRGPGQQFFQSGLSQTDPDGELLYGLVCAGCHKELANSKVKGADAREIEKKISEDEGGMGVLTVLSTQEIDALAAVLDY